MSSNLTVTIGGVQYDVLYNNSQTDDTNDGRSTAQIIINDLTGTISTTLQPGMPVVLIDAIAGYTFEGVLNDTQNNALPPGPAQQITCNCVDGHYYADKRYYAGPEYQNRYAGDIAVDMLNKVLSQEGITATYAVQNNESVADWSTGSLSSVVATNNIPGGDLELAPAGTALEVIESGSVFSTGTPGNTNVNANGDLAQNSFYAIKMAATQSLNNGGNTYSYVKFWDGGGFVVSSNTYFAYDVFVVASSPEIKIGLDVVFTDGSALRNNFSIVDFQFMTPNPGTDLTGLANGQWYHRSFGIGSYFNGKTVAYASIACEGDKVGDYVGYIKNVYFASDPYGVTITQWVYNNATTFSGATSQLSNAGYSSTAVTIATCYDPSDYRWTPSHNLSSVGIAASTYVSWQSTQTDTSGQSSPIGYTSTPNGSYVEVGYSLDGGNSYILCNNNAPLPNFPAGLSVAGLSIQFIQFLYSNAASPEDSPTLNVFQFVANPGIAGAKTDLLYDVSTPALWAAGTMSNVTDNSSPTLSLSGFIRNWDDANSLNQPLYGGAGAEIFTSNKTLVLGCDGGGNDARCQNQFAGSSWQTNFVIECDVQCNTNYAIGIEYLTTNWGNSLNGYAYSITITPTQALLNRGTNSTGGGASTGIGSSSLSLTSGDWHRLKVVYASGVHTIDLDNVQLFSATDSTWTGPGYVGLRIYNNSGSHQRGYFDNFGVTPALTGTWTSPAMSLSALSAYFNSDMYWADVSSDHTSCTVTCAITTNGGSTWTTLVNGADTFGTPLENQPVPTPPAPPVAPVPIFTAGQNLSGVTVQLQFALTTTTASSQPAVNAVFMKILGAFNASGSRISTGLPLAPVARIGNTQVDWSGIEPLNSLGAAVTSIIVDTSLDGSTWSTNVAPATPTSPTAGTTTFTGAGSIPGLVSQTTPVVDLFTADSSMDYTTLYQTGGALATWVWDIAHKRLEASGGNNAILLYNSPIIGADVDVSAILDTSDNGGFVWRYQDQSDYYYVAIHDASNGTNPNIMQLYVVSGGTRNQIGGNFTINFTRGTPHAFRVIVLGTSIQVLMDGVTIISKTDSTITAAGFAGLRTNTSGGSSAQFYMFRLQFYGQSVAGTSTEVYTRVRLTSSDPTLTPQVISLTTSVRNANIQSGALIPSTSYSILNGNKQYISSIFDDLCKQSGSYWWKIIQGQFYFQQYQSTPAPFPITGNDTIIGQAATQTLEIDNINDLYRNSEWIPGGTDVLPLVQSFRGDGETTSFDVGYKIDSITAIWLNGAVQLVGIKGVDTGKQWYYTQGSTSIVQDTTSNIPINDTQKLKVSYNGQISITVNIQNPAEIARQANVETNNHTTGQSSGIVEVADDGNGLTKPASIQRGYGYLSTYAIGNVQTAKFTTLRFGLAPGQLLGIFNLMGIFAGAFLITEVKPQWYSVVENGVRVEQPFYAVVATNGPVTGDWTRFINSLASNM